MALEMRKYFFYIIVIALLFLSYMIIKDFIISILNAVVIVVVFYPLYRFLEKKIKSKCIASVITTLLIIILIIVPLTVLINGLVKESGDAYSYIKIRVDRGDFFYEGCSNYFCELNKKINFFIDEYNLKSSIIETISDIGKRLYSTSFVFLMSLPSKILNFIIMISMVFFLFIEGENVMELIKRNLPLNEFQHKKLITQIKDTTNAIVYGQIIVSMFVGIIGGLGLYLVGIPNPIILGIIMAILSLLPVVGSSLIWIPASLYLIINGIMASENIMIIKGTFLLIGCMILVSLMELILKPKIIGERASVHPMIILIGILGGITYFGIGGFILGPIILSVLVKLISFYETKKIIKKNNKGEI